jgi:hypothetical protein
MLEEDHPEKNEPAQLSAQGVQEVLDPAIATLSIAATISSPVTCGGQLGTVAQGRFGVLAS